MNNSLTENQNENQKMAPIEKICTSLSGDTFKEKLQQSLPPGLDAERFSRTAINAIQMHPQKDKFDNCDIQTLFLSVQKAATDGLLLDGREGTLIAFWNKDKRCNDISYIPMVQGLVKAARNSGEIVSVDSHVVYMDDAFSYKPGIDPQPNFNPDWKVPPSERGDPVLAYCVITLKDGTVISPEPMHKERIMKIGNAGNNGKQYNPKQGPHFTEWWKKTVIKNALKYAPKSSELLQVETNDNEGQDFDFDKLRDISNQEQASVNDVFKPTPIERVEETAIPIDKVTGEILEEQPAAETQAQESTGETGAFASLKAELLKTRTVEAALALKSAPAIARITADELPLLGKAVDTHIEAIKAGMLD